MKHIVTVTFDGRETKCEPPRIELDPGDTVQWTSPQGELALDFAPETPFTSTQVWKAHRGESTPLAIVRPDTERGRVFRPAISIDSKVVAKSLGDVIIRVGG
jgi:hypothetical protein